MSTSDVWMLAPSFSLVVLCQLVALPASTAMETPTSKRPLSPLPGLNSRRVSAIIVVTIPTLRSVAYFSGQANVEGLLSEEQETEHVSGKLCLSPVAMTVTRERFQEGSSTTVGRTSIFAALH
jgi:hypothetical protein